MNPRPPFQYPAWSPSRVRALLLAMLALLGAGRVPAQNIAGWGDDSLGQTDIPVAATNAIAVAAGYSHSLALMSDGTVLAWGDNTVQQTIVPPSATNVVAIAAGYFFNLALRADGSVVAWGDNSYGQTNVPDSLNNAVAIAAGRYHALALRADGTVVAWGENVHHQTNVPPSATNIIAISAGAEHCLALRRDGSALIWGGTVSGTGVNPPLVYRSKSSVPAQESAAVAAGAWHDLALTGSGSLVAWGLTSPAPLVGASVAMLAGGTNYSLALQADGTLLAWNSTSATNPATILPAGLSNLVAIAAGGAHGLAVVGDGSPRIYGPISFRPWALHGSLLPLSVRAAGAAPLHFQWLADGVPIDGNDSAFPQIPA